MHFVILFLGLCLVFGATRNPTGAARITLWLLLAAFLALILFGIIAEMGK
jgi:hypothetical protein